MTNRWIWRRLNSWGYGVQSPNDFYFVQHVLREELPYYAYPALEELSPSGDESLPCHSSSAYRLLFRLANYAHPATIVEVGAGASIAAMAMACPTAQCVAITGGQAQGDALQQQFAKHPQIGVKNGDEMEIFRQLLREQKRIEMLHIASTDYYRETVEAALPYVNNRTLIIISGIQESREKQAWWEELKESPLTGVSYDLGNMGLLFFDKARYKVSYWITLKD